MAPSKKLKIIEVKYCSVSGKCIDITKQVKAVLGKKNVVEILINNAVGGDPEPGVTKKFVAKYLLDDKELVKEGFELTVLKLP